MSMNLSMNNDERAILFFPCFARKQVVHKYKKGQKRPSGCFMWSVTYDMDNLFQIWN